MRAIRVQAHGEADVLRLEELPLPEPPPGHLRVRLVAAGLNFIEIYQRRGWYPVTLPWVPGSEGAGLVSAVGRDVEGWRLGDPVASVELAGAYAEEALVRADRALRVPAGLDVRTAAGALLQGMTAHYLACHTYALGPDDTCVVHAAAGGVGLLLVQVARLRGARVIAVTSTAPKAELARAAGAQDVVVTEQEDFLQAVKRLSGGRGVQVVYDSVGRDTWERSLDCLAPRGLLALYGQSSGLVPPIDPARLAQKGSLFLTRPALTHYVAQRADLERRAADVFGWILDGRLKLRLEQDFPLARAADAQRALETRATTGKLLLRP